MALALVLVLVLVLALVLVLYQDHVKVPPPIPPMHCMGHWRRARCGGTHGDIHGRYTW